MKQCPKCRRNYYDDSLLYCLDDGAPLLEGPSSMDEPATAILSGPSDSTAKSRIDPSAGVKTASNLNSNTAGILGVILIMALGLAGYLYYQSDTSKQIESIAVMPFVNESGNPNMEYLSDGMTETIISSLSQLPNLSVKPRSSVFRYKGKDTSLQAIGKELNVQAILTGRVVQRGDRLTLSMELADVQKDSVIWSEQYDRRQADLASLQSEIARDVSRKLRTKLSGEDEQNVAKNNTENAEAYQLYLKGRYHYNKFTDEGYYKGIEYFTQATGIDPNYALAYTGLADCYFGLSDQFESPDEMMPKARAAAEKALALNDSLAEAHASLGLVRMFYELNWVEAEREFQRATNLDPNYANGHLYYSRLLVSEGRADEAVNESELSVRIEPLSPINNAYLGYVLLYADRHDEAIAQLKKALELNDSYAVSHYYLGNVYQKVGELDKAIAEYEKALELNRNARYSMALGNAFAASGQREKALRILSDLTQMKKERHVSSYFFAAVHAGLNNRNEAFALLDKAFEEHADSLTGLKVTVFFDNLRPDPRYKAILKRANLTE